MSQIVIILYVVMRLLNRGAGPGQPAVNGGDHGKHLGLKRPSAWAGHYFLRSELSASVHFKTSSSMAVTDASSSSLDLNRRSSSRNWATNGMLTDSGTGIIFSAVSTCLSIWVARVPAA